MSRRTAKVQQTICLQFGIVMTSIGWHAAFDQKRFIYVLDSYSSWLG